MNQLIPLAIIAPRYTNSANGCESNYENMFGHDLPTNISKLNLTY